MEPELEVSYLNTRGGDTLNREVPSSTTGHVDPWRLDEENSWRHRHREETTKILRDNFLRIRSMKMVFVPQYTGPRWVSVRVLQNMQTAEVRSLGWRIVHHGLQLQLLSTEQVFAALFIISEERRRLRGPVFRSAFFMNFIKSVLQNELLDRPEVIATHVSGVHSSGYGWRLSYDIWNTHLVAQSVETIACLRGTTFRSLEVQIIGMRKQESKSVSKEVSVEAVGV
jgi:hypothetical protein